MARRVKSLLRLDDVRVEGAIIQPDVLASAASGTAEGQSVPSYGIDRGLNLRDEIGRAYLIAKGLWATFNEGVVVADPDAVHRALAIGVLGFGFSAKRHHATRAGPGLDLLLAGGGRVPVAIAGAEGVDHVDTIVIAGADPIRRSATTLVQGEVSARDGCLWGIATNGLVWRLLRDNESITRPGYIEIDLARILRDDLYADFSAFWLIAHRSRFPEEGGVNSDCALERWRQIGLEQGVTARKDLRDGVQKALFHFGRGFLENPANTPLIARVNAEGDNRLTNDDFFRQLLRLVYRLIFVMTAEDREILHLEGAEESAKAAYVNGYATGRLRERSRNRIAWDRYHDAYEGMKVVFRALSHGEPKLALLALGGLFAADQTCDLDAARLTNKRFLNGFFHLAWLRRDNVLVRINWRDMETEEFGSVYESLLELNPAITNGGRSFSFVGEADEDAADTGAPKAGKRANAAKGNERKTTGSYYTPDSLVQLLLKEILDPVIERKIAEKPTDPEALLTLKVIDPACGSGHFLVAAANHIARRLADLRHAGAPARAQHRHALREVARHCIYGVDRNPMAVELCKVALWIEALEPGRPLTFLDSHICCGDSLIGVFDLDVLRKGLPDEAFEPLTGDERAVTKAYAAINSEQRDGKTASGLLVELRTPAEIASGVEQLLAMPEDTLQEVEAKQQVFQRLYSGPTWWRLKTACDMYVAAFLMPKRGDVPDARKAASLPVPTTEAIWRTIKGGDIRGDVQGSATDIAVKNGALHWPLVFPHQMAGGGFDAVIGNPPWERIKLQEQEFFAARDVAIASAPNKAERDKLIAALKEAAPGTLNSRLSEEFELAKHAAEAASVFARKSGRFPLTGMGDVNTYALFAELFSRLALPGGRAGVLVPTGIATDSSTCAFFGDLVKSQRISALISFDEVRRWFPSTDDRKSFCFLGIGRADRNVRASFEIGRIEQLADQRREIDLSIKDFELFNPNTLTAPLFRARFDRELTESLYRAAPALIRERPDHPDGNDNPWGITFQTLFHMSNDSKFFRTGEQLLDQGFLRDGSDLRHGDGRRYVPLLEAKMIHHFDHRFGSYAGLDERPGDGSLPETPDGLKANPDYEAQPWYWVPEDETNLRAARVPARLKQYYRKENPTGCLKVLAEWVLGTLDDDDFSKPALLATRANAHLKDILGQRIFVRDVIGAKLAGWLSKVAGNARDMQRETPLFGDDLAFIRQGPVDPLELTSALIERKQPRWLMGWRDICRSTDERTVIATALPKVGVGHTMPLAHSTHSAVRVAVLIAQLASLLLDYAARQKLAGTHLTYFYLEQLPVLARNRFTCNELTFVKGRVLELTYTSRSMVNWAEDLGYAGKPFRFDLERRALLRAELDAFFALKHGITRDKLRYILDPADVMEPDYPSETFRVLKENEMKRYGEYRTRRLVLEAWDRQSATRSGA
jgi:hypothetical protein